MSRLNGGTGAFDCDLNRGYLKQRRTKIVATVGPASSSPEMLRKLIAAGLDVARVNFSHGEAAEHAKLMERIRAAAKAEGRTVAILADLCGPKIRVGKFEGDSVTLVEGRKVTITVEPVMGTASLIPSQYRRLVKEVRVGERILLDDGNLELRVTKKAKTSVEALVVRGGLLKNNKGMNLPNTALAVSALTAKDKSDVKFAVAGGADYVALSFVRHARDIRELRRILDKLGSDAPIIAKIEKPEALANIDAIIAEADGIMVARGDLGVELPTKKVPFIQNKLIQLTRTANKPVIVATQMLESMIGNSRPTRAEVTDVAGACLAGTDAVMLSAETAAGKYPVEAVSTMDEILREAEAYQFTAHKGHFGPGIVKDSYDAYDAIGDAVALLSRNLLAKAIFAMTRSGATARLMSADRPAAPIHAFTASERVQRRLNLHWGVYPQLLSGDLSFKEYVARAGKFIKESRLAVAKDYVLVLSGLGGSGDKGSTNTITVHRVE